MKTRPNKYHERAIYNDEFRPAPGDFEDPKDIQDQNAFDDYLETL